MTDELEISTNGPLGRIALNRPQAINALSRGMIEGVSAALMRWRDDPAIGAVLFTGNGTKGFCSGGDVRAARAGRGGRAGAGGGRGGAGRGGGGAAAGPGAGGAGGRAAAGAGGRGRAI